MRSSEDPTQPKKKKSYLIQSSLGVRGGLVPGLPRIPKSADAQILYIKWLSTLGPPYARVSHPQIQPTADQNTKCRLYSV